MREPRFSYRWYLFRTKVRHLLRDDRDEEVAAPLSVLLAIIAAAVLVAVGVLIATQVHIP